MKVSQLKKLIKEEVNAVLKEQEASGAMTAIDNIKNSVKELTSSDIVQNDAVLQHLLAKYTGLLGKITSYIKKKYNVEDTEDTSNQPQEDETNPEDKPTPVAQARPKPPVKPQPKPSTPTAGAPDYAKSF